MEIPLRLSLPLAVAAFAVLLGALPAHAATVRIMQSEPPRSMDPADHTATATASILEPMYEGLVQLQPDGSVTPVLATSWTQSDDGLTWRFVLRAGVHFHDGAVFDAVAAKASFDRLLDRQHGLAAAGMFRGVVDSVSMSGADVVFHLHHPFGNFLRLLGTSSTKIVAPSAARAGTLGHMADGTGPYRFGHWDPSTDVEEIRFDGYWGHRAPADRLVWTWSSEASIQNMALRSGDVDVAGPFPPLFADAVRHDPAYRLLSARGAAVYFVALNTLSPPLDQPQVRRALSLATDRAALVSGLLHGFGRPACAPVPPEEAGCGSTLPDLAYDPAQARATLRAAGLATGFDMTVAVMEPEEPIAEALQAVWAQIGVRLHVRRLESGVWANAAFEGAADKRRDGIDAVLTSWATPFEPDMQLRPLYDSRGPAPHGANLGFYVNKDVDSELDRAATTTDEQQSGAVYTDIERRIVADMPSIPLYTPNDLVAARRDVTGLVVMPGGEMIATDATLGARP